MSKICSVVIMGVIACLIYVGLLLSANVLNYTLVHEYQPYSETSNDDEYVLKTQRLDINGSVFAGFSVYTKDSKLIFQSQESYRVVDLHYMNWFSNSLDIYVDSFDVGAYMYRYSNGMWYREISTHDLMNPTDNTTQART